jgi:hypothetical protein
MRRVDLITMATTSGFPAAFGQPGALFRSREVCGEATNDRHRRQDDVYFDRTPVRIVTTGGECNVDEILFGVLAEYVGRYLDAIDQLAVQPAVSARRLSAAWRALLGRHRPAGRGGCTGCGRRRLPSAGFTPGNRRDRGSWCGVWRVASSYFVYQLPLEEDPSDLFTSVGGEALAAEEAESHEPGQSGRREPSEHGPGESGSAECRSGEFGDGTVRIPST